MTEYVLAAVALLLGANGLLLLLAGRYSTGVAFIVLTVAAIALSRISVHDD